MRFFKTLFIIFAILVAVPFVVALFLPKNYSVEQTINIDKPKNEVYRYIVYFKNLKNYDERLKQDADLKCKYKKRDGREGFVLIWKSRKKEVGVGQIKIVDIVKDDEIEVHYQCDFYRPYAQKEQGAFIISEVTDSSTHVLWQIKGTVDYPTNITFLWNNFEEKLNKNLSDGLENLKTIIEKRKVTK